MGGPVSIQNWKDMQRGAPCRLTIEHEVFTDAHVCGEIIEGFGPYKLLNTIRVPPPDLYRPAIILRAGIYLDEGRNEAISKVTDAGYYHGGGLADEVAALVSLCFGIRVYAGGVSRWIVLTEDPLGRPMAYETQKRPPYGRLPSTKPIMPNLPPQVTLSLSTHLRACSALSDSQGIALIRAARLYQDALWESEVSPDQAWLKLVSAIEVAAASWTSCRENDSEIFKIAFPPLFKLLHESLGQTAVDSAAAIIAPLLKSTKKFVGFLLAFGPAPASVRPPSGMQVQWDEDVLKKSFTKIYDWRSRALHAGIPFPLPMCLPPGLTPPEEKPLGLAMAGNGGSWRVEDTPMLLHTFEYIARNALLNWWASLIPQKA